MLRLDEDVREKYDLSSMIAVTVGTAPSPPHVKRAMIEWWGPIISESYGGTEGNGMTLISSEDWLTHPGSVGQTVFGTIHIVRDDGSEAGPGEVGVIHFSGGKEFEYYKDPAKTASVKTKEGWSTIGDVGYVDSDGYLYITDRVADVIISGGLNIYSREVEDCLLAHPDVDDAAVIGVPNEEYGEEVKAVVSLRPHAVASDDEAAVLLAHCRDHLARYKCPRSFDFVDELPRQSNGKLYKRLLRDQYKASH
jgi:long-chain acyl-CoA synthetase